MPDIYEFTLLVAGADLQTDEALNSLAEAGCDDATVDSSGGVQHLDFDREESSYLAAVMSAISDVEAAVPGARVIRVLPDEYVSLVEIADRTGRTRESVRLLSIGERGPGGFPPTAAREAERRWTEVAAWFTAVLLDQDLPPTRREMMVGASCAVREGSSRRLTSFSVPILGGRASPLGRPKHRCVPDDRGSAPVLRQQRERSRDGRRLVGRGDAQRRTCAAGGLGAWLSYVNRTCERN